MSADRRSLLELHALAQDRGDGLIPGFYDLLCGSMCEGVPGGNVVELSERMNGRWTGENEKNFDGRRVGR